MFVGIEDDRSMKVIGYWDMIFVNRLLYYNSYI